MPSTPSHETNGQITADSMMLQFRVSRIEVLSLDVIHGAFKG